MGHWDYDPSHGLEAHPPTEMTNRGKVVEHTYFVWRHTYIPYSC